MHSNYEWQKHQTNERIQQRLQEAQRQRLAGQKHEQEQESTARSILRLPLRLVTAVLRIGS